MQDKDIKEEVIWILTESPGISLKSIITALEKSLGIKISDEGESYKMFFDVFTKMKEDGIVFEPKKDQWRLNQHKSKTINSEN